MAAGDFQAQLISPAEFVKDKVKAVQDYSLLVSRSLANLFRRPVYLTGMIQQADLIGVGSLPIVILTGGFTGAVLALNSASTLSRFGSLTLIAQLVSVGMVTELGPVITGLMVAGRNASGMASELGSMTVTKQIDAMPALGTDPTKKLVISAVGCYFGMSTRGGTQGVGRSTTQAVVVASVMILVVDFFVTKLLITLLGYR